MSEAETPPAMVRQGNTNSFPDALSPLRRWPMPVDLARHGRREGPDDPREPVRETLPVPGREAEHGLMIKPTSAHQIGTRRRPVSVDRATWRLGPVVLDRVGECVYLLRPEGATARHSAAAHVVCVDHDPEPEVNFAW